MENQIKLTTNELSLLTEIKAKQNEEGHSDFLSMDAKSRKNAGTIKSLEKKGMIYNSYDDYSKEELKEMGLGRTFKMWCLTDEAIAFVGKPDSWS